MKLRLPLIAIAVAIVLSATATLASAQGLEQQIQRCRGLTDAAARLACYDAIGSARSGGAPPSAPAAVATAIAPATPVSTPTAPTPAAPVAVAATAAPPAATERFGLPDAAEPGRVQAVESRVGDDFFGWGPNERIGLANGQVWQVIDGSSGAIRAANRKVQVRRAALGSFLLEFEGLNYSVRVRRVQ
jgi:hypothetical protein